MGAPDRELREEHSTLNPPVIPAFFTLPKRGKMSGPITQTGWEGFKIVRDEDNGDWKCKRTQDFTLTILADGYCEIPDTKANRAKFEKLCQPVMLMKPKMKTVTTPDQREVEVPEKDANGRIVYTDQPLREEPAQFRRAKGRRIFNSREDSAVDMVRPWLRQFVDVPDATLEEIPEAAL